MDAGAEQTLGCIDVADSHDDFRIHDGNFDGDGFVAQCRVEISAGEMFFQGLRTEIRKKRVRLNFGRSNTKNQAESAWVVVTQLQLIAESDADMIVLFPFLARGNDPQASRHAQMNEDHIMGIGFQKEIFRSAFDRYKGRAFKLCQVIGNRLAQIVAADDDFTDTLADEMRRNAQARGFDFR